MRTLYIPVECGNCIECRKKKTREWQVRLLEDIKHNRGARFVTLTFSNESILKICEKAKLQELQGYTLDNAIATWATKWFRERWRKRYGKSIRHWLVTELGHKGTENIHMHGLLWTDENTISEIWEYGFVWDGEMKNGRKINYVNERTIGYITKYVSKQDAKHQNYKPIILTSKGIGGGYINRIDSKGNKYKEGKTNETYRTNTGHKIGLPIYWRNKIYTDDEKEKLWIEKLDKNIRYIRGEKIDVSKGYNEYWKTLRWYQRENIELGYGNRDIDYNKKEYEEQLRIINQETRIKAALRSRKIQEERERLMKIIRETYNNKNT